MLHRDKVKRIQEQIISFYEQKKPYRTFHGSTNSTRTQEYNKDSTIDTSFLNEVIEIDDDKKIAIVEPNVPMYKLVEATLGRGLIPGVLPEFPSITVGGAISGVAGESSSFKYGVFAQICSDIEIITPDGELLKTSQKKNSDLFNMLKGAFGTLGVITKVTINLIPAKKYVNLTYLPVESFDEAIKTLSTETKKDHDYVDGIMFSHKRGTIIVGKLSDECVGEKRRYSRARDEWYYLDAEKNASTQVTQTIPIKDYLFRYDRGAFWMGERAFKLFDVSFNRLTRFTYNPIMHTRKMYEALQVSGAGQQYLVQDLGLPLENAVEFLNFIDSKMMVYPIWLCPLKPIEAGGGVPFQLDNMPTEMCINIGVWSDRIENYNKFLEMNRILEKKLMQLGGRKWFYAHAYYTQEEFWKIYDKDKYDKVRQKYNATHLPTVFDKVVVTGKKQPVNFKKGALKATFGRAKLRIK